mmetsp:Transcript_17520/g.40678  ORF Transcript_17520/g.40678 Transcript_17520/m.40678 type:complete len:86 (-) Transcript_17520:102-359(-)
MSRLSMRSLPACTQPCISGSTPAGGATGHSCSRAAENRHPAAHMPAASALHSVQNNRRLTVERVYGRRVREQQLDSGVWERVEAV